MKKIICIVLALSLIAAAAMLFAGCGDEKTKSGSKQATTAPTSASATEAATLPPSQLSTVTSAPLETITPQADDNPTQAPYQDEDEDEQDYYTTYGGLSGQEAILKALSYVGSGYQCVYYDRQYLHNQEAWYIGIQASDGSDDTVYYLYVNSDTCIPVSEIPNIGGNNSENSGVFSEDYAGISEQEAIFKALGMMEDEYACVSSEKAGVGATEYWLIGIQKLDDPSADILYFFVNRDSVIQQ